MRALFRRMARLPFCTRATVLPRGAAPTATSTARGIRTLPPPEGPPARGSAAAAAWVTTERRRQLLANPFGLAAERRCSAQRMMMRLPRVRARTSVARHLRSR